VLSIYDLDTRGAHQAITSIRKSSRRFTQDEVKEDEVDEAVSIVGGRLSFLNRVQRMISLFYNNAYMHVLKVAKSRDMVHMAKLLLTIEKGWLLSQIGECLRFENMKY